MNNEVEKSSICEKYLYSLIYNDDGIGYFLLSNLSQGRDYDDLLSLSRLSKADLTLYLYLFELSELIKCEITIYEQKQKAIAIKNYLITENGSKELIKLRKTAFMYLTRS